VQEEAGYGTDLIWGNCFDEQLGDRISVTVIATGFGDKKAANRSVAPERKVVHLDEQKKQPKRASLEEITGENDPVGYGSEKARTFEFEDMDEAKARLRARRRDTGSFAQNYLQEEEDARREAHRREMELQDQARREALRQRSELPKLSNPKVVNELESQPAYLRRNIQLDSKRTPDNPEMSRWSITDDEKTPLRRDNSFLHDNVD
jgi:cell division protein FtsZ